MSCQVTYGYRHAWCYEGFVHKSMYMVPFTHALSLAPLIHSICMQCATHVNLGWKVEIHDPIPQPSSTPTSDSTSSRQPAETPNSQPTEMPSSQPTEGTPSTQPRESPTPPLSTPVSPSPTSVGQPAGSHAVSYYSSCGAVSALLAALSYLFIALL